MKKAGILIVLFLFKVTIAVAQCPMCKAAVESNLEDGGTSTVGMGLNTGILYLMIIPYVMVAAIGIFWYRAKKKQEKNAPRFT